MLNWWKNFIDKLAKANDEAFKGETLDCCSMIRNNNLPSAKYTKKQNTIALKTSTHA